MLLILKYFLKYLKKTKKYVNYSIFLKYRDIIPLIFYFLSNFNVFLKSGDHTRIYCKRPGTGNSAWSFKGIVKGIFLWMTIKKGRDLFSPGNAGKET
jgi:hypothetical protein